MANTPDSPFSRMSAFQGRSYGRVEVDAAIVAAAILSGENVKFVGPKEHQERVFKRAKEIIDGLTELMERD